MTAAPHAVFIVTPERLLTWKDIKEFDLIVPFSFIVRQETTKLQLSMIGKELVEIASIFF